MRWPGAGFRRRRDPDAPIGRHRMSGKRLAALALLVTVVVAGGLSYYASTHPDGLEFVAGQQGFADRGRDSSTSGSPLADYETRGVEDQRLSSGLAGLAGVAVVLGLGWGLFWLVRRPGVHRPEPDGSDQDEPGEVAPQGRPATDDDQAGGGPTPDRQDVTH